MRHISRASSAELMTLLAGGHCERLRNYSTEGYVSRLMHMVVPVLGLQYVGLDFVQKLAGFLIRQSVYLHRRNVFPLEAQMEAVQ